MKSEVFSIFKRKNGKGNGIIGGFPILSNSEMVLVSESNHGVDLVDVKLKKILRTWLLPRGNKHVLSGVCVSSPYFKHARFFSVVDGTRIVSFGGDDAHIAVDVNVGEIVRHGNIFRLLVCDKLAHVLALCTDGSVYIYQEGSVPRMILDFSNKNNNNRKNNNNKKKRENRVIWCSEMVSENKNIQFWVLTTTSNNDFEMHFLQFKANNANSIPKVLNTGKVLLPVDICNGKFRSCCFENKTRGFCICFEEEEDGRNYIHYLRFGFDNSLLGILECKKFPGFMSDNNTFFHQTFLREKYIAVATQKELIVLDIVYGAPIYTTSISGSCSGSNKLTLLEHVAQYPDRPTLLIFSSDYVYGWTVDCHSVNFARILGKVSPENTVSCIGRSFSLDFEALSSEIIKREHHSQEDRSNRSFLMEGIDFNTITNEDEDEGQYNSCLDKFLTVKDSSLLSNEIANFLLEIHSNQKKESQSQKTIYKYLPLVFVNRIASLCLRNDFFCWNPLEILLKWDLLSFEMTPNLLDLLVKDNNFIALEICLKHLRNIPDEQIVSLLHYFLGIVDEELLEYSKSTSKTRAIDCSHLHINLILCLPYNNEFAFPENLKILNVEEIIQLLKILQQWLDLFNSNSVEKLKETYFVVPGLARILDWLESIFDAHFPQLILSEKCHEFLHSLLISVLKTVEISESLKSILGASSLILGPKRLPRALVKHSNYFVDQIKF